jgi:hypothetical protein
MNVEEAGARACEEPTLAKALAWIAVWEAERAIGQALRCERTGQSTAAPGQTHDTCFEVCFTRVLALHYGVVSPEQYRPEPDREEPQDHWEELKAWLDAEQQAGLGNSHTRPYRRMARQTLDKMRELEKA